MRIRSNATRLGALAGAVAVLGGLLLGAAGGTGVLAQTGGSATPASSAGGPASVPSARFYGTVTPAAGSPTGAAAVVTASIGGVLCGSGTAQGGTYTVDVQAIAGCTTPGATVTFTVGGMPATASPAAALPPLEGTAVNANLTVVVATATPAPTTAPPPPPPTRAATTAPPPPPPRASATAAPRPSATAAQGQRPAAPAAQKPAGPVVLPKTGSGSTSQSTTNVLALASILFGAALLGVTGLMAARKSR